MPMPQDLTRKMPVPRSQTSYGHATDVPCPKRPAHPAGRALERAITGFSTIRSKAKAPAGWYRQGRPPALTMAPRERAPKRDVSRLGTQRRSPERHS